MTIDFIMVLPDLHKELRTKGIYQFINPKRIKIKMNKNDKLERPVSFGKYSNDGTEWYDKVD